MCLLHSLSLQFAMQSEVIEHVDAVVLRRHPQRVTGQHEASVAEYFPKATCFRGLPYGCIED